MKAQLVPSRKPTLRKKVGWAFLLLMAAYPVLFSLGYLTLNPADFSFTEQTAVYLAHHGVLMVHIVAAMLAILIGPFQFLPRLRTGRLLKIHHWLGRAYLVSVLAGGLSGLYMAQFGYGGLITELGFATLAILWLYSGYRAYKHIRNREIEEHRQWMIRNYALTFAGTMLRVWVPVLVGGVGVDFTVGYILIAWLCWVPNLLVAEWIIRRSRRNPHRAQSIALPETRVSLQETAQPEF
jgi:uncharacterized membrane protein